MRQAMAEAEVGDDVMGEDPTLNMLQEEVAALLGKEAALFVPSGTMSNQVALKAHTEIGDEVIIHPMAHIVRAEGAAGAAISGVQFRQIGNEDGSMTPEEVAENITTDYNPHFAPTRLVAMENTHNFCGGSVVPLDNARAVAELAHGRGVATHLDGARLMNAAIALNVPPAEVAAPFDSVSICFSKGLGAPVGSAIVGSKNFIHRCHRYRKMFGGGMRQGGILAAAARYALEHNVERLAQDHENARALAQGLMETGHVALDYGIPDTNILFFHINHPTITLQQFLKGLEERGVLMLMLYGKVARAVTHLEISRSDIDNAISAAKEVLSG